MTAPRGRGVWSKLHRGPLWSSSPAAPGLWVPNGVHRRRVKGLSPACGKEEPVVGVL